MVLLRWFANFTSMKKVILSLLLVISFITNKSYAGGGFCSSLEKI
jgi:hypothetical protein